MCFVTQKEQRQGRFSDKHNLRFQIWGSGAVAVGGHMFMFFFACRHRWFTIFVTPPWLWKQEDENRNEKTITCQWIKTCWTPCNCSLRDLVPTSSRRQKKLLAGMIQVTCILINEANSVAQTVEIPDLDEEPRAYWLIDQLLPSWPPTRFARSSSAPSAERQSI